MLIDKKSRTLVNIIGIPLIISSIYVGGLFFNLLVSVIILLGTVEFINISKKATAEISVKLLFVSQILLIIITNVVCILNPNYHILIFIVSYLYIIPFVIIAMIIEVFKKGSNPLLNISSTIFGFIWIGLFLNSLICLRYLAGPGLTLSIISSIWVCDTFAFYFGKTFGKTKIMPEISPNKTWVGSLAGLFGALLFLVSLSYFKLIDISLLQSILIGVITGGISQFGDFFESTLKRSVSLKDTSNILRGHGGILDRFDSLVISAPLTLIIILIINI